MNQKLRPPDSSFLILFQRKVGGSLHREVGGSYVFWQTPFVNCKLSYRQSIPFCAFIWFPNMSNTNMIIVFFMLSKYVVCNHPQK